MTDEILHRDKKQLPTNYDGHYSHISPITSPGYFKTLGERSKRRPEVKIERQIEKERWKEREREGERDRERERERKRRSALRIQARVRV